MEGSPHRALARLHKVTSQIPKMSRLVDTMLRDRGKHLPDWPKWCLLPMVGWGSMIHTEDRLEFGMAASVIAAVGNWRYSQGIYRFDPDLLEALLETPITGDLPCDILYHLPEWCLYVEVPQGTKSYPMMVGFWVHLEYDINTSRAELRFLLDCDPFPIDFSVVGEERPHGVVAAYPPFITEAFSQPSPHARSADFIPVPLHLGPWPLKEAMSRMYDEAQRQFKLASQDYRGPLGLDKVSGLPSQIVDRFTADTAPLLALVLYLCSQRPEVDDDREPGWSPYKAQPRRVHGGWRLFPAVRPRFFTVGRETGRLLRTAKTADRATGRSIGAHLRRAHWHGYWIGPRSEKQKFQLRWLSPFIVGRSEVEPVSNEGEPKP